MRGEPHDLGDLVWTRTIVGVRRADPATYRADVRAWAAAVIADVESVEVDGEW
ncbi:hypothetical protein BH23ACT5_BH23ACT5_16350 [soil metagenome]